jgi:hypothetical protein
VDEQAKKRVPGEFRVVRYAVRAFRGDYRSMEYGDPTSERLRRLDEEFGIAAVVADCGTEFEAFLALKRWVRSRWDHGWSRSFQTVADGLDILRAAATGERFCCGHYSRVFVDCATALGWPARQVGISIADCEFPRGHNVGNVGHSVAEIWSNEHEKWVLMDPDVNCYYARDAVPLNALEIRDAWLSGKAETVTQVFDEPAFVLPTGPTLGLAMELTPGLNEFSEDTVRFAFERFSRHRTMDYYARVRIAGWEWADERCLPTFVSHFQPSPGVRWTSNVADMYWSVNMVRLAAAPAWNGDTARLSVTLDHCMPFFDHFEARTDGGGWERCDETLDWPVWEGVHRLECRAVNVVGRPGIVSAIDVAYARPRW